MKETFCIRYMLSPIPIIYFESFIFNNKIGIYN